MLIAQALAEDLEIVTSDTRFDGYKRLRVVWE
jgi:PIN domain nuclease of toxin-antitoxin system